MTALNFPTDPDTGATYEAPNNTIYIYDGQKWNVQGTTITSAASINFVQDSVAPLFSNISGDGISFTYDSETNVLSASVTGGTTFNGETAALTLTGKIPYVAPLFVEPPVVFTRPNNSANTVDAIATGLTLKRNNSGALFNSANNVETSYSQNVSPLGTLWNADGWGDLADVKTRTYTNFTDTVQENTWLAAGIHHKELVMHDTINDKYWTFKFSWWQVNGGAGSGNGVDQKSGFSYVRQLINTDPTVYFVHPGGDASYVDDIGPSLSITRGTNGGGIYNASEEGEWDADVSPYGTLWNDEGWDDFADITTRTWKPFFAATHGRLGNEILNRKLLIKDTVNNKYYVIMFTEWGSDNGGSFAYWRREVDPTGTKLGITFADGTIQTSAFNPGDIRFADNTITSLHNTDVNIQTTSDPLINADININSSDDVYITAKGGEGFSAYVDNDFYIQSGQSQFKDYDPSGVTWVASTIVFTNWNNDLLRSLQVYSTNTYDIDFRLETGEWKGLTANVYSVGNAVYDSGLGRWTIPINLDNTGPDAVIINIRLRDPDWDRSKGWNFHRSGSLIPDWETVTAYQYGSDWYSPTLKLGAQGNSISTVITDTKTNSQYRGNNWIRIQGQKGYGDGNSSRDASDGGRGTSIGIYGGLGGESNTNNQGGEGGHVDIRSGDGQHGKNGGYVQIKAGGATWSNAGAQSNTVYGGPVWITGGDATNEIQTNTGIGGDVSIRAGNGNLRNGQVSIQTNGWTWNFKNDGSIEIPNGSQQDATQNAWINAGSPPTVMFTSVNRYVEGIKAIIKVNVQQAQVNGDYDIDTQICEMLITRKMRFIDNGSTWIKTAVATVYGVTHTSDAPLATFTVNLVQATSPETHDVIQILAEPTAAVTGTQIWVQTLATELIND